MAKIQKEWKLPKPVDHGTHYEWSPVVRVSRHVPYGYTEDPNDADVLLPNVKELELLEQAKKHLKRYSYRAVAAWLSEESGHAISHVGLFKRVRIEHKRRSEAANQRFLAERYKEALEKAERLEGRVGGIAPRTLTNSTSPTETPED